MQQPSSPHHRFDHDELRLRLRRSGGGALIWTGFVPYRRFFGDAPIISEKSLGGVGADAIHLAWTDVLAWMRSCERVCGDPPLVIFSLVDRPKMIAVVAEASKKIRWISLPGGARAVPERDAIDELWRAWRELFSAEEEDEFVFV